MVKILIKILHMFGIGISNTDELTPVIVGSLIIFGLSILSIIKITEWWNRKSVSGNDEIEDKRIDELSKPPKSKAKEVFGCVGLILGSGALYFLCLHLAFLIMKM